MDVATLEKLQDTVSGMDRYRSGTFSFPFGEVGFVDGASLLSQYQEIFQNRGYDFQADRENPLILDCGANIGLSIIRFKQIYPQSRITAFEADREICTVLKANLDRMGLNDVSIVNRAVWSSAGRVSFDRDGADAGRVMEQGANQVSSVCVSEYIQEPVDLLKLDVEGAEFEVIEDLVVSDRLSLVRRLIAELHVRGRDRERTIRVLQALCENGFHYSFAHARSAPDLPGVSEATPFPCLPDAVHLLHLYAWKPN